jgi:hypothetical protein
MIPEPRATEGGTGQPETLEPETLEPETLEPEASQLDDTELEAGEPEPSGLWKITLGELDEKMGVKIVEESV